MSTADEYEELLSYKFSIFGRAGNTAKEKEAEFKKSIGRSILYIDDREDTLAAIKSWAEKETGHRFSSTGPTLFENFSKGSGNLKFALAVFLLMLKSPKYRGAAIRANEVLFGPGGSIEKEQKFKPQIIDSELENAYWGLTLLETKSINSKMCSFDLMDFQRPSTGEHLEVFLEISAYSALFDNEYEFGFGKLAIETAFDPIDANEFEFSRYYNTRRSVGKNGEVILRHSGSSKMIELNASYGILDGLYDMLKKSFFQILNIRQRQSIGAKLMFNKSELSLLNTSGKELPSKTKQKLIALIEADSVAESDNKFGWLVLSTQKYSIEPKLAASRELD